MLEALLVSNAVLWLLVLALTGVVLALVRQIGVLHERVAPAGALLVGGGPKVGEQAPPMELHDLAGRSFRLGARDAKQAEGPADDTSTLVLFVSPTCPVCKTLLPVITAIARREKRWLRVALASDGARVEHEAFVRDFGLGEFPYLLSTALGLAYQVGRLPYAVLIDERGVLRAKGLVNSREHLESLFEAQARGVESIQQFVAQSRSEQDVA